MPAPRSFKRTSEAKTLQLSKFRPCHQQELQGVALLSLLFQLRKDPSKKTLFLPPPEGAVRLPVFWLSLMDCDSAGNED